MSRKKDKSGEVDNLKMSKEQDAVAKYLRFNCPTATTLFEGNEVHYFSGNRAVDTLLESKYGKKAKKDPLFKSREDVATYISDLFTKQLFFRAKKLVPKKKEDKEGEQVDLGKSSKKEGEKKNKKNKDEETVTETEVDERKKDDDEETLKEKTKEEDKKKKKKVKLLVHNIQVFVDDKDVYVWVFDPTPLYKKVIGVMMLLGTIVGCLFPLWPMWLRQAVYYLSLAGIGVFAAIVVVAILRTIVFGLIWLATMGQHKLWILPNLTEDCGVLESFQPWYTYEYCPRNATKPIEEKKSKNKKSKEKNSDNEETKEDKMPLIEKENSSVEDDFDRIDDVDKSDESLDDEEKHEDASSVPPSPEEHSVRKRRPKKI